MIGKREMGYRVKITYIYHSSFFVEFPECNFLFDLPHGDHLPKLGIDVLRKSFNSNPLFVFFSHSHDDHFNPDIEDIITPFTSEYKFIISYDIYADYASRFGNNTYILEPEDEVNIDNIKIRAYESNDLGNAYFISFKGINIYYGGDLAEWIWPDTKNEEKEFIQNYFEEILKELRLQKIHIGFSNMDPRLKNFGGGIKFLQMVQPDLFIPMHTFGRYDHLIKLKQIDMPLDKEIFIYSKIGDKIEKYIDV